DLLVQDSRLGERLRILRSSRLDIAAKSDAPPPNRPDPVLAEIDRDPDQPGLYTGLAAEAAQVLVRLQECLLGGVLNVVRIAQETAGDRGDLSPVSLDQDVERGAVAHQRLADQAGVVVF